MTSVSEPVLDGFEYIEGFLSQPEGWFWSLLEEFYAMVPNEVRYGGRRVVASSFRTDELTEFAKIVTDGDRHKLRNKLWLPMTGALAGMVAQELGMLPDMALFNLYRDGQDGIELHADPDAHFGPTVDDVVIATISLGQRRSLQIERFNGDGSREIDLGSGSLYVMRGTMQREWLHAIKRDDSRRPRLSVTFTWHQREPRSRQSWALMKLPSELPDVDPGTISDLATQVSTYDGATARPVFVGSAEETFRRWRELDEDECTYAMTRGMQDIIATQDAALSRFPQLASQYRESPPLDPDAIDLRHLPTEFLTEMVARAEAELQRREGQPS